MCTRFNLWSSSAELAEYFELFREPGSWSPKYNISPLQRALTIRNKADGLRHAELMQWGLVPSWANDPGIGLEMINASADVVVTRRAFRGAFRRRRCLIPATGFYIWQRLKDDTTQPWHVFSSDGLPMAFAGLWESWQLSNRSTLVSCSIITTDSNRLLRSITHRMPVILPVDEWNLWLAHTDEPSPRLAKILVPCPAKLLEKTPVSSYVNHIGNHSRECIKPVPDRAKKDKPE